MMLGNNFHTLVLKLTSFCLSSGFCLHGLSKFVRNYLQHNRYNLVTCYELVGHTYYKEREAKPSLFDG